MTLSRVLSINTDKGVQDYYVLFIRSPECLVVIDHEIFQYATQFLRGFEFNEETLSTNIIQEVVLKEESFLSHDSTLSRFRDAFWIPELFEHLMLRQWQDKGGKSIRERAKEIAKRKIKEHEFELSPEVQRELNKIYQRAKGEFER